MEDTSATTLVTEQRARQLGMDELVGYILLIGVAISMVLITIGLAWRYAVAGTVSLDYHITGMNMAQFVLAELRAVKAENFRPRTFVSLGIMILMLTPLVRVAASMLYFMVSLRNWKYSLFTGFVLAVLAYSLFLR